ncbi:MAG: hypothetical protein HYZ08_02795 [Candidatus Kerfeldbacteria bacterium]|nr:hypothetical protein [Candidatus Kerfeldbacteria bacterium]
MYLYVYDAYVQDAKYEGVLANIENRLIELGINGKVERLSYLKSPSELILEGLKRGARTVVAVGNDDTFKKVLTVVSPYDIVVGLIPVGGRSRVAEVFGIGHEQKACDTLSMRLVQTIDLLEANQHVVFSSIQIPSRQMVTIEIDGRYRVTPMHFRDNITISNLGPLFREDFDLKHDLRDPQDGLADVEFQPVRRSMLGKPRKAGKPSVFSGKHFVVVGQDEKVKMIADLNTKLVTPLTINVLPCAQKVIVGKKRKF